MYSSMRSTPLPPPLEWAQRKDRVWITVKLENCKNPIYELKENTFYFKGKGGTDNADHEVSVELFGEIDPAKSTCSRGDRQMIYTLIKKDPSASFWPRLTKESKKFHFIRTDFSRWRDEDDSDVEDKEDFNIDDMMNSMGGLNGGGDFGGDEDREDSDDEDIPDLE
ncbi:prostaglandin E synthase 3-like isoform X2 [Pomacea canaliculata]|uniref:prostaglandin E synthase 3-like isoform X2 n=1 Tax=Pomacea canaliculata TaxID=400727 RepID=UPI000D739057|nr:prostaglandin E synthase 3-like isoform X2 [Pomacea canaliculata]